MGIAPIAQKMRERLLQWYGYIMRAAPNNVAATVYRFQVGGKRPCGRPRQRWQDTINEDMTIIQLCREDALNRTKWRTLIRPTDPAPAGQHFADGTLGLGVSAALLASFDEYACDIEHHLFPTMPRCNLNTCMRLVKEFCRENNLPYLVNDYFEGYALNLKQLENIARLSRAKAA
ncbi:hypothetical protein TELCIR_08853 [Teladorsagia circumcincta]|uniref:Uncharacterized protein n=1 Tax=Teladorsagia circumcincta TaxID=45464 RepID=A0A2G9UGF2_TELCI|nr:hypothetical protein TELCIR_08853 [Teladorsagia circumcincta]